MVFRKSYVLPLLLSGFFFALDQILKYVAHTGSTPPLYLIRPWLGWEYFGNLGIAFSIPFPNILLIIGTPVVLLLLLSYVGKKATIVTDQVFFGASLIFFGAISNLIDRILFALTIDYIRIVTSVINIADCMIVIGTILLLVRSTKNGMVVDKKDKP